MHVLYRTASLLAVCGYIHPQEDNMHEQDATNNIHLLC